MPTIDDVKNFWDKRPCNIRHSDKPVGSRAYWQETEARKYFIEPHIQWFADFHNWFNKKVLEIGCGIGIDTANFSRCGAQVTAIDVSQESLQLAETRLRSETLKAVFYNGDAEQLDIPPQVFDLIYAFGSIHHSPNPERILQNAKRYSNPDTLLRIMVYNRFSWKVLWIFLKYGYGRFWKLDALIQKYSEAQTGCPVTHTYSKKSITELLERNGWKVKSIKIDHIFPYKISDYVQYRYTKVWYFRWLAAPWFRWLERHFGWHLLVEAEVCR